MYSMCILLILCVSSNFPVVLLMKLDVFHVYLLNPFESLLSTCWLSLIDIYIDEFCNNCLNCVSTDNQLTRKTPPAYADGVYMLAGQNRPSPRKLSQFIMKGADGLGSTTNRTALLAFFGKKIYLHNNWS